LPLQKDVASSRREEKRENPVGSDGAGGDGNDVVSSGRKKGTNRLEPTAVQRRESREKVVNSENG